ncbi:MAG: hypothetical protein KDC82_00075 [Bacteroidetes bacterium]|nr:hypothetical protein [Bacteroidota bacterium]
MHSSSQENYEYLASRHTDPALDEPRKQIIEYYCKTCELNINLEKMDAYEREHKQSYVPPQIRKVKRVGLIFTANSIMAEYHFKHRNAHDWGQYQPYLKENPKS